jgi:hypothetical protein
MNAMSTAARAARAAYEIGRLRVGAARALAIALGATALAAVSVGTSALAWVALPWLAWTAIEWRGGDLRIGGTRGLFAGMVTLVLPMTWLRPCCAPGMTMGEGACCAQPWMCVAAGAVVGLLAGISLPPSMTSLRARLEATAGIGLALASVAALRCTALLLGEAAGLLVGVTAGVVAASLAGAVVARVRARLA